MERSRNNRVGHRLLYFKFPTSQFSVEQREPSPDDDVQPVEERNTPGEVLTDIMEIEEPAQ